MADEGATGPRIGAIVRPLRDGNLGSCLSLSGARGIPAVRLLTRQRSDMWGTCDVRPRMSSATALFLGGCFLYVPIHPQG